MGLKIANTWQLLPASPQFASCTPSII